MKRSRRALFGLVSALIVLGLVLLVLLRFDWVKHTVMTLGGRYADHLSAWAQANPREALAGVALLGIAAIVGYLAHKLGRWRTWAFATVLLVGLWFILWYIPQAEQLSRGTLGLNMSDSVILRFALAAAIVASVVHWVGEAFERYHRKVEI